MAMGWQWLIARIPKTLLDKIGEYYINKERLDETSKKLEVVQDLLVKQIGENLSLKESLKKITIEERQKAMELMVNSVTYAVESVFDKIEKDYHLIPKER